jgi:hypothetical protein
MDAESVPANGVPPTLPVTEARCDDDDPQAAASSRSANRFMRRKLP